MSNAFVYRMPAGVPGDVGRLEQATIEPNQYDTDYPCLAYGILVKLVASKIRPIASGDDISAVGYGFLVRPYPIQEPIGSAASSQALSAGAPNTALAADVLRRGYMTVKVTAGGATAIASIAKGDAVYVRSTADTGKVVGDIEAGSISGNDTVTGAIFMGAADTDGNVEIAYNI